MAGRQEGDVLMGAGAWLVPVAVSECHLAVCPLGTGRSRPAIPEAAVPA